MRILMLSPVYPYPSDNGAKRRIKAILEGLVAEHEVTFVSIKEGRPPKSDPSLLWKESLFEQTESKLSTLAKTLWGRRFYREVKFWNPKMEKFVRSCLNNEVFDAVLVSFLATSRYLEYWYESMPEKRPLLILDQHNLDEVVWSRHSIKNPNYLKRKYASVQYNRVVRLQKYWFPRFDLIFSVSQEDLQGTQKYVDEQRTRLAVASNGVDTTCFSVEAPVISSLNGPGTIVFGGSMDVTMNQDAIHWFMAEVFPIIEKQMPGVKFWIVGRNPPPAIQRYASPDQITVTGTVEDILSFYRQADVFVIPLRMGGGTKLKTLEAMSLGLPIVSTQIGVQGLDVVPDRHLYVADDAINFANRVVKLLTDRKLAHKMGKQARELAVERYDWASILKEINAYLTEICDEIH